MNSVTLNDWNEARKLAKDFITSYPDDFDSFKDEWNHADLPNEDVLIAAYETVTLAVESFDTGDTQNPPAHILAKWLLQQDIELTPTDDVDAFFFENWKRAQTVASNLAQSYKSENGDSLTDSFPGKNSPSEDALRTVVKQAVESSDSVVEETNEIAQWLQKYHRGEVETPDDIRSDSPEGVSTDEWGDTVDVADQMLDAFGSGDTTYSSVKRDASITIPHRDRMMMAVMNSSGSRAERIRYVAEYIVDWSEHEEEAIQSPYRPSY